MRLKGAFKLAVVEYLAENLGIDKGAVAVGAKPGKPRPDCGDLFVCVWGGGRTFGLKTGLDVTQAVNLTLTKRFTGPMDRWDVALSAEEDGFDELAGRLICLLTAGQNQIRELVAAKLPDQVDGTSEAPRVLNDPEADPVGADWFGATTQNAQKGTLDVYGFAATIAFGGLRVTHPWDTAQL